MAGSSVAPWTKIKTEGPLTGGLRGLEMEGFEDPSPLPCQERGLCRMMHLIFLCTS